MTGHRVFQVDGSWHEVGNPDCCPLARECPNCYQGLVHYQGVYEGYFEECDVCGRLPQVVTSDKPLDQLDG